MTRGLGRQPHCWGDAGSGSDAAGGHTAWRPLWKAVWQFLKSRTCGMTPRPTPESHARAMKISSRIIAHNSAHGHQDPETAPVLQQWTDKHAPASTEVPSHVTRVSEEGHADRQAQEQETADWRLQPNLTPQGGHSAGGMGPLAHSEPSVPRALARTGPQGRGLDQQCLVVGSALQTTSTNA